MTEDLEHNQLVKTARVTGIWYLMLAISGMTGFLFLHGEIYEADNPAQTLANLRDHEMLARVRLVFEFLIIMSQALAAVWFYKLFKDIRPVAAWALAAWGLVNAVAIMISAMAMGGAITVANDVAATNEKVLMIRIFSQFIREAWGVGSLFFGLWLIPMGYIVVSSRRMPVWLGRVLILGGGDGLGLREVLAHPSVEAVTLVDLDHDMTTLSLSFPLLAQLNRFAFSDRRVTVVNDDASVWLDQTPGQWDVIIIDFPDPNTFSLGKLYTKAFYRRVLTRLAPGGAVAAAPPT